MLDVLRDIVTTAFGRWSARRVCRVILPALLLASLLPLLSPHAQAQQSGSSAADVIEYVARWRSEPPGSSTAALTALYYMLPGSVCDSPPSGTGTVDGHRDVTTGVITPTYGRVSDALACTVGVGQAFGESSWDKTVKIKFKNNEDAIALCSDVDGLIWKTATQDAAGVFSSKDCDGTRLANFRIPNAVGAPEYDLVLTTQSGPQIVLGQWDGDGEWNLGSPPACDTVDWQEVESSQANKDAFQCTVDGTPYKYADFHILTTDGTTDVCADMATALPSDELVLFCGQDGTTVRAIHDWYNSTGRNLTWLQSVEQIGSRSGGSCGLAGATETGRCANQLVKGQFAFRAMAGEGGAGIAGLDTSNLQAMEYMFQKATAFNEDISRWNTSKVRSLVSMFEGASSFNQPINTGEVTVNGTTYTAWDVSSVTDMQALFSGASAFDQKIGDWDTSKVELMAYMFAETSFDQDISGWVVNSVRNFNGMFFSSPFDQAIGSWQLD
ncbi:MAG: BspA family leucine-rich repeat surface protein, partial [Luminiphilus sp.]